MAVNAKLGLRDRRDQPTLMRMRSAALLMCLGLAGAGSCTPFPSTHGEMEVLLAYNLLFRTQSTAQAAAVPTAGPVSINGGWTCSVGVNCQDVYDFTITGPVPADTLTVTVSAVTGTSTLRMAVFAPGVALSGTNLTNGGVTDRRCFGQNIGDTVGLTNLPASGTYRIAVGRDWGLSGGASGTYTLSVSMNTAKLVYLSQTVEDTATQLTAATTCP